MQKILILVGSIFVMHSAYAGILEPKRTDPGAITVDKDFRLETDLGYLVNNSSSKNGSSKQDNLTAHILFQKKSDDWGQELIADAVSTHGNSSAQNIERYYLSGKILHRSSNVVYRFGKITAEKDLTSIFDHQITTSIGWGVDVLKSDKVSLSLEMGGGYRYSQMQESEDGKAMHEGTGTLAGFYIYQISPDIQFNQDISFELGKDSKVLRSRSALSADLTKKISAVASYSIKNVQADEDNNRDSLLSLGLRYRY